MKKELKRRHYTYIYEQRNVTPPCDMVYSSILW